MSKEPQPSLFPDIPDQQPPVDTDEVAERIGRNARPVEYQERTSGAAADQGWGPVDTPETAPTTSASLPGVSVERVPSDYPEWRDEWQGNIPKAEADERRRILEEARASLRRGASR